MAKILEIEFKGSRRAFYANPLEFPAAVGDLVVVRADKGEELGRVVNMGALVDQRAGKQELPEMIRKPSREDITRHKENQKLERETFFDCRKRIEEHGLGMKLVDVEYQFDRNKITFFFTAEKRVDFRNLVRDLAGRYRTRIELRQIGVRDEAKRMGGIGLCGRRLCCTTFLREFEPVVTQFAKEQNLPLNPTKLSGCCGRLMCCLRYEREFYAEMLKNFPEMSAIALPKENDESKKPDGFKRFSLVERAENADEKPAVITVKPPVPADGQGKKRNKKRRNRGQPS
jgi:cell fate regulator YaaT (PSP1 superfamily)